VRKKELPFVRSFARSIVHSFVSRRGDKENNNGEVKRDDERKKEQK
jgi:hypothetical protein